MPNPPRHLRISLNAWERGFDIEAVAVMVEFETRILLVGLVHLVEGEQRVGLGRRREGELSQPSWRCYTHTELDGYHGHAG